MKTFIFILCTIFTIIACNGTLKKYSRAIINDTKKIFTKHKEYIYETEFLGDIIDKNECRSCNINKYTLTIRLKKIINCPIFSMKQYPPYYTFITDSILSISVSKVIFDASDITKSISKKSKSLSIVLERNELQYLSDKKHEWLPSNVRELP